MAKTEGATNMTVKIIPNDKGNPPGKLADGNSTSPTGHSPGSS